MIIRFIKLMAYRFISILQHRADYLMFERNIRKWRRWSELWFLHKVATIIEATFGVEY